MAETDIELTSDLFTLSDGMIQSEDLGQVAELEDDIIFAVLEMEDNGARINVPMLREWLRRISTEFTTLIRFIHSKTGLNVNPNSAKDLVELFNVLRLSFGLTEKGAGSFTDAFLKTIDNPVIAAVRLILDLMLPDLSGTELCRRLRSDAELSSLPIIMLTAKAEEVDRVVGFELGADDYVTKPFSPRELVLRVGALLRRSRDGRSPRGARAGRCASTPPATAAG